MIWEIGPHQQTSYISLYLIDRMQFFQVKAVFLNHLKRNKWKFNFKTNTFFFYSQFILHASLFSPPASFTFVF